MVDVVGLRGGLMVCGTTSDAGKSVVVAGLCRLLARRGVSVAPFKAQNMALNSAVTASGHEIGRAQYLQAQAAGIEPEVACNPILLKPTGERTSQVVVNGRPIGTMSAAEYHAHKPALLDLVLDALADLRRRFDVVLLEGAGSPAEINLLAHDIVNLRVAQRAGLRAVVVGDIDRGGVFAALHGTVELLPAELRACVGGFIINKLRGDPALLLDGTAQLEAACGMPTLGVLPMLADLGLDAEDSLFIQSGGWAASREAPVAPVAPVLDVAVIALPQIANFTDLDPLAAEAGVAVRLVHDVAQLGRPHLIVLPGSKHTVADLAWLRRRGLAGALADAAATGSSVVLGICAGYQMLGRTIIDDVESGAGTVDGLGLLDVDTRFEADKLLRRAEGEAFDEPLTGYQIHHGRVRPRGERGNEARSDPGSVAGAVAAELRPWLRFAGRPDGYRTATVLGTSVHGLFESDGFRRAFLAEVAAHTGATLPASELRFAERRLAALDRMADTIEQHCDLDRLVALIAGGSPPGTAGAGSGRSPDRDEHHECGHLRPERYPTERRAAFDGNEHDADEPDLDELDLDELDLDELDRRAGGGEHGGDGQVVARALGLDPASVIDLSASLNPFAPDTATMLYRMVRDHPTVVTSYPDPQPGTRALAARLGVAADRVVVTNGGAEAIALLAEVLPVGWVTEPEFSLYRRHLREVRPGAPRWRSNPSNPLGRLADPDETAAVWDEAYYPLATGRWTRGDEGAWRLGSLTKLWACPGIRLGYVIAPDAAQADRIRALQPQWSVNGPALAVLEPLLDASDIAAWAGAIAATRARFAAELRTLGYVVEETVCNWLLVDGHRLRPRLLRAGIVVRDCTNYGMPGRFRVAIPHPDQLDRVVAAFAAAAADGGTVIPTASADVTDTVSTTGAAGAARPADVAGATDVTGTTDTAGWRDGER